jgi:REP element-mobilizing transposase RayT
MRYTGVNVHIPHKLMLDWTGWLSGGAAFPPATPAAIVATAPAWAGDGLRLDTFRIVGDLAQILFATTPGVSPTFLAARAKGRLQHALRTADAPVVFSRKVSVRSVGENTRADIEGYLARQVARGEFADPRFRERMARYTVVSDAVDLAAPTAVEHGRHWYNLHVVLVTADRFRFGADDILAGVRDAALAAAERGGHALKSVAVMPDHVHLALRGNVARSPREIGVEFQNALADVVGCRAWQDEFYAGTFSEYDVTAIRR